jgi:chaperonin GroES
MLSFARAFSKSAAQMFRPLFDRILVERIVVPSKTAGGILIPEVLKGKHNEGIVIATGTGHREKDGTYTPLTIKKGDRVVLGEWGGSEVKLDGKEYVIFCEDEILGVLNE